MEETQTLVKTSPSAYTHPNYGSGEYRKKRSSISVLKPYITDYIVLAVLGVLSLTMYLLPPVAHRLFMVGGEGVEAYEVAEISYPVRTEIFSTMVSAIVTFSVTISVIAFFQIWVRSLKDFHHGFLGLLYALILSSFFQTACKWIIGGLRPNFLSVCKPDITNTTGVGFRGLYYSKEVCTGDGFEIQEGMQGFPSGHSSSSFAGFLFLTLYLNAKLKVFFTSPYRIPVWKILIVISPILAATLISLSRLIDFSHNWADIICGAIIGIFIGFMSYSALFRSVFRMKDNHLPCKKKPSPPSWNVEYRETDTTLTNSSQM